MSRGFNPSIGCFVVAAVTELDGSTSFDSENPTTFETEIDAKQHATEMAEDGGGSVFVFQLIPVAVAKRGKVTFRKVSPRMGDKQ